MITSAWDNEQNKSINKIPLIAICIPYSQWEPEFTEFTYTKIKCSSVEFANKVIFLSRAPSLPVARDGLVMQALNINADYLLFLDSDMVFEQPTDPNDALRSLYSLMNKDPNSKDSKIVSGLYRARQKGMSYAMWSKAPNNNKGYIAISDWTGNWIDADTVGLGCCLIDMKVFKDTKRPWFKWDTIDDISEDFQFMEQVKKQGYNVKVMTDIKLSHIGKLKIKCNGDISMPEM